MKISNLFGIWKLGFTPFVAFLPAVAGFQCLAADPIDWNRYGIEGREISGNHERAYRWPSPPVRVHVTGRSADEAVHLVDGLYRVYPTSVQWPVGETAEITLDLQQPRFVSAIVIPHAGNAEWELSASPDNRTWWEDYIAICHTELRTHRVLELQWIQRAAVEGFQ